MNRGVRLQPLPEAEAAAIVAELAAMEQRIMKIAVVLGPAYGAATMDRAIKVGRSVWSLMTHVRDRAAGY
jgi:hypothetical protein